MAMMVRSNCRYGCCHPDPHRAVRAREKRSLRDWADEYENRPEDEARGCPKGGLECRCHLNDEPEVGDLPDEGVYSLG
ncbi:hypothetical protein [Nocardia sp. CC227C]|uniref:hypothetical protein n=1 Tax=Nocardia sp. CC227C TaxID=3044562 RepID=UPI00278BC58A|nr:hypothetical protein [Nocardia sp. CC227C]